jgi:DNA-binding CsgD family transcriptional regulator
MVEVHTDQPALFSDPDLDRQVVDGGRTYLHTGTTISKHTEQAAAIISCAGSGWSQARIARELGHSPKTVRAVLRLAETDGKLARLKERVLEAMRHSVHEDIELGDMLRESIRLDLVNGVLDWDKLSGFASMRKATWVGGGISEDKGAATLTVHGPVNVISGSVVQVVEDYRRRQAAMLASDSESGAVMPEPEQKRGDSAQVMPSAMPGQTDSGRSEVGIGVASEGRGGGCDSAGGPGDTDGKD